MVGSIFSNTLPCQNDPNLRTRAKILNETVTEFVLENEVVDYISAISISIPLCIFFTTLNMETASLAHTHTHTHTHAHTHTHTHTHARTHTHTHTLTRSHAHTNTHSHAHTSCKCTICGSWNKFFGWLSFYNLRF